MSHFRLYLSNGPAPLIALLIGIAASITVVQIPPPHCPLQVLPHAPQLLRSFCKLAHIARSASHRSGVGCAHGHTVTVVLSNSFASAVKVVVIVISGTVTVVMLSNVMVIVGNGAKVVVRVDVVVVVLVGVADVRLRQEQAADTTSQAK
jgi:hypothetical protein